MLNFFKEGKTESYSLIMQSVSECCKDDARGALRRAGWARGEVRELGGPSDSLPVLGSRRGIPAHTVITC